MAATARRSKFAMDIMFRLFDETHSRWVAHQGKNIWSARHTVEKLRERMVAEGRNPETLSIERVFVEVK